MGLLLEMRPQENSVSVALMITETCNPVQVLKFILSDNRVGDSDGTRIIKQPGLK